MTAWSGRSSPEITFVEDGPFEITESAGCMGRTFESIALATSREWLKLFDLSNRCCWLFCAIFRCNQIGLPEAFVPGLVASIPLEFFKPACELCATARSPDVAIGGASARFRVIGGTMLSAAFLVDKDSKPVVPSSTADAGRAGGTGGSGDGR